MADVVISYSGENAATVRQLAEAIRKSGREVWWDEAPSEDPSRFDAVSDRIGAAKAAIVVWSKAAIGSEWVKAEANVARSQKKLIQVSADGASPPPPFDPGQVAEIQDWLGQPDHPGWRDIRERLDALAPAAAAAAAGADPDKTVRYDFMEEPEAALPPPPPIEALAPLRPAATPASAAAPAPSGNKGLVLIAVAVLGLLAAAAAAYVWMQGSLTGSTEVAAANEAVPAPPPPAPAPAPAPDPTAALTTIPGTEPIAPTPPPEENFSRQASVAGGTGIVRSAPSSLGITVARIAAGDTFSTYPQEGDWWRVRTADGTTGYMSRASIALREPQQQAQAAAPRPKARPTGPRVRYKYSENMRLFCEGPGRDTRECRTFRRNTRQR